MGKYCDEKKEEDGRDARARARARGNGGEGKGRRRKKLRCPGFISSHYDPRALSSPLPLPPPGPVPPFLSPVELAPTHHRTTLLVLRHLFAAPSPSPSFPSSTTSSLTLNFLSCITGCFVFRRGVKKKKIAIKRGTERVEGGRRRTRLEEERGGSLALARG